MNIETRIMIVTETAEQAKRIEKAIRDMIRLEMIRGPGLLGWGMSDAKRPDPKPEEKFCAEGTKRWFNSKQN